MITKESLIEILKWVLEKNGRAERFAKSYLDDPLDTLDGCDSIFEMAAETAVARKALNALTGVDSKATVESILEYAEERVRVGARSPRRSTSVTSNLAHQSEVSAYARLVETIKRPSEYGGF